MNAVWKMPDGEGGYYTIYHETTAEMVKYSDTTVANVLDGLETSGASEFMQSVLRAEDAKAVRKLLSVNRLAAYDESETTWTPNGGPIIRDGKLSLDGASYIRRDVLLPIGGGESFTIELIAQTAIDYSADSGGLKALCSGYADTNNLFLMTLDGNKPRFIWKQSGTNIVDSSFSGANLYESAHHLAISYDGATLRFFVDGQKAHELAKTLTQLSYRLFLGYFVNNSNYTALEADEFRVSDVCRYTEDFTPAARHDFDEHTLSLLHFD